MGRFRQGVVLLLERLLQGFCCCVLFQVESASDIPRHRIIVNAFKFFFQK